MLDFFENLAAEAAFETMQKNSPDLLKTVEKFVEDGLDPEQIIDICVEKSGEPRHRLAFIGCVADYLISQKQIDQQSTDSVN